LEKSAKAGIPHLVFTGGEPTTRPDLIELIKYTEERDLVCGLITDGSRLSDPAYLHSLLDAGLDHLMLLLDDSESTSWEALKDAIAEDIYLTVHITIKKKNFGNIRKIIDKLSTLGVPSVSLSIDSKESSDFLSSAQQYIQQKGIKLVWDLPVPYSSNHPVAFEIAENEEYFSGAGKAWLYIEPDGDVLPDQDDTRILGNILIDPWEKIWNQS
jgi:MoaA/NifB/PqqE/SkfB family radical SAM enzyme